MNNSAILTTTFCRKCKKIRSCLETNSVSNYRYLCKECAKEEHLIGACVHCGRVGIATELLKHAGYCHLCENDNLIECNLCGAEIYNSESITGICKKCYSGENKACVKCGTYTSNASLNKDGLCTKCSIKIHKRLRSSKVNEVVECVECGRECYVNDLNDDGLCIYCYANELESEIVNLKKRKKTYY